MNLGASCSMMPFLQCMLRKLNIIRKLAPWPFFSRRLTNPQCALSFIRSNKVLGCIEQSIFIVSHINLLVKDIIKPYISFRDSKMLANDFSLSAIRHVQYH